MPENRLPIKGEFYTLPNADTIVIPLETTLTNAPRMKVQYDLPKDLISRVKFELAIRKCPPVANMTDTRLMRSRGGKNYLLIAKYPKCDRYIRQINPVGWPEQGVRTRP